MGLGVTGEVGQMSVVVAVVQQGVEDGREDAGFLSAEMMSGDQIQRGACLWCGHFNGRAVHHEFHVARAAEFVAGRRDLLGYVARGMR